VTEGSHPLNADKDERELVAQALSGRERAWEAIIAAHRQRLYRSAVHMLGWRDSDAEDVVQEVFLAAWKGLAKFEFRSSLNTWLTQILIYRCYRRIRERGRVLTGLDADLAAALGLKSKEAEPLSQLLDRERRETLAATLLKMGRPCQEIIRARDLEGKPYAALSELFKIPMGTVMSRLARCRERLKDLLLNQD